MNYPDMEGELRLLLIAALKGLSHCSFATVIFGPESDTFTYRLSHVARFPYANAER
jgi:hypothetical protein